MSASEAEKFYAAAKAMASAWGCTYDQNYLDEVRQAFERQMSKALSSTTFRRRLYRLRSALNRRHLVYPNRMHRRR